MTLSTDFVPGYEFDEVGVVLDQETRTTDANVTGGFFAAAPVGQFFDVTPLVQHTVSLSLRKTGAVVAERSIAFSESTDVIIPVVMSRECAQTSCEALQCSAEDACLGAVACTRGVCTSGICLQRRDDTLCGADERCVPGVGCLAREVECEEAAECEDNYLCTRETCERGRCVVTADHASCEDDTICAPTALEADPVSGCAPRPKFDCGSGEQTIPLEWRCDGFANCFDFSDEQGCGYTLFTCANGTQAIRSDWACDTFVNCPDQSDETNCGVPIFVCEDGFHTTRQEWVCDGSTTCPDFSDEEDCGYALFTCANGQRAIRIEWRCDAFANCEDGSDEVGCP